MRKFHMAPDGGLEIAYVDTIDNHNAAFPFMKELQQSVAIKFDAKADAQKVIMSPQLDIYEC